MTHYELRAAEKLNKLMGRADIPLPTFTLFERKKTSQSPAL